MIPYGRQDISQEDIDAVVGVLRADFLTQGPVVPQFERAVASRVKATFAVAVNSATSALHVACMALDLGPGDWLWTVPNTFVASANCGRYVGAQVDFVDIDPLTWNMSVPRLREKLAEAEKVGRLPKVLVAVHFAGQPTEQEAIWELASRYGVKVVEDASHAIGGARHGEPIGSCRWSDITVFSFHPVKVITTAEGGMATTNHAELAERMMMLRSHGITRDPARFLAVGATTAGSGSTVPYAPPSWYYEQQMLGFNYRLTDLQAALGITQLARLDAYIDRRNKLARRYNDLLRDLPLQLPCIQDGNTSAFHLYVVRLARGTRSVTHRHIVDSLRETGIGVNLHYMPVHLQPYYRDLGFTPGYCPEAEAHGETAITIPLYATMTDQQQDEVVDAMRIVLQAVL